VSVALWHAEALEDVEAALRFGQTRWPRKAEALASHLIEVIDQLAIFPLSGREGEGSARELVLTTYPLTIIYEQNTQGIIILRVVHQRQQWPVD
jgi:plasmid stabilization system protein ParE